MGTNLLRLIPMIVAAIIVVAVAWYVLSAWLSMGTYINSTLPR